MLIVDAHLDLSYNALRGRDVLKPARMQARDAEGIPTVGLPDLKAGGVDLICATIFTLPSLDGKPGYQTADEAHAEGMRHLDWYRRQSNAAIMRFITLARELAEIPQEPARQHAILLLEGADPLRTPADVGDWYAAGMRIVGLAWKATRYAGGTGQPGPLTSDGIALVRELDRFGIIHDTSHLAELSFWQLLDLSGGPVMASHSNCRAIVPTDRQLSDEMIRALAKRNGVIGINFFDRFLLPPDQHGKRRATLADVAVHARCICDLTGNSKHVAIGTDMDGGLGRDEIPIEIETSSDLPRVAEALSTAGFGDGDVRAIMGGNWMEFFTRSLPQQDRGAP
jgi:membrane dipeptidase